VARDVPHRRGIFLDAWLSARHHFSGGWPAFADRYAYSRAREGMRRSVYNRVSWFHFAVQVMASVRYPRQREYPHPPPPSTNNTRRTINRVVIYLFSIQRSADWGPKLNVCEHNVETRGSRKLLCASLAVHSARSAAGQACCLRKITSSELLPGEAPFVISIVRRSSVAATLG
jgi:hypothetical protein